MRLLVVRRRNRCWDDVPREVCGEHLTIRSLAVSSTLPTVLHRADPRVGELMLFVGDDWAEGHHDIEIVDDQGKMLVRRRLPGRQV